MSISLYPSEEDYLYEEEVLRNPTSYKLWWRYLIALSQAPFKKRAIIYERALRALPGSYKLWHAYLRERLEFVRNLPITHSQYDALNNTFERALATLHKMPRIWILYLQSLTNQKLTTKTRRTFDRALCALPVTQHGPIWENYLVFVSQKGIPIETSLRVYRRYLKYDPSHIEDFIEFLVNSELWQDSAEKLAEVLNVDRFYSTKGKTKHMLWLELCDLLSQHGSKISGLNVDAVIRGGFRKFMDEVGKLWTSLADFYIRRGLFEKARDIFEEGMTSVITMKDFGVIFDAYLQFEESMLSIKMEYLDDSEDGDSVNGDEEEEVDRLDINKLSKKIDKFWLKDENDVDLRLARLEFLMDRRPEMANSVLLRNNPHNVELWHRRVKLFEQNPTKKILTYTEAVRTVDPMKAVGKPHTLWVAFAKLYEDHKDVSNARVIFDKAVQVNYKSVDHLASLWCEWTEMEIRHKNFKGAMELMRRATAEPSVEVKKRVAAGGDVPVQMIVHKSLKIWTFYVDLEDNLGSLDSTRAVYERILDLKIATPQIIINYAKLLEDNKYFEDAFKVYERGTCIFKYPHVKYIWDTYLTKLVERYAKSKLDRVREVFRVAVQKYAKLEEDFGLDKNAMGIYDKATKAVPNKEKLEVYEKYIARATKIFGVPKTKEIYEQAIHSGLPKEVVKVMCLRYADDEKSRGEINRSRALYNHASNYVDPITDSDFWSRWHEFEVQHGNEDTFREMLRTKRTLSASRSQIHSILPEYLMQKDQLQPLEEDKDVLKMANDTSRRLGFVSAGVQNARETRTTNQEDIELPDYSDSENDFDIAQKDVPSAVFGDLARKRNELDDGDDDAKGGASQNKDNGGHLGALERIKRRRGASEQEARTVAMWDLARIPKIFIKSN
ncbi:pre-mRNA-splicing factor SYF1 [Striga asiatica]|uniref:Pre-mRNA-splicing factor SYF1 n=1 Tax=Striga asiatica TaxID=4170 RepID=A0A5A7PYF2_STRAF|nr:pre-mRNA-splicing factor SYF1 [Striga asiatica]